MEQVGKRPFCIVDVFAEEKYAGNQLAVVLNTIYHSPLEDIGGC
jgi:predicted PhzF superfamily epimerase YddE/YHI9